MLTDSMYNGHTHNPVMITFAPAMTPESLQMPKSSTKASALGLPSPIAPPSTPCTLLRPSRTSPARSNSLGGDPYPTSSPESKRRRCKPSSNKRAMNAFLIYRKHFPSLYPHIDALERHQGPKSAIIGAMWRAEPPEVKEHFFGLQQVAAEEFRISTGQLMLAKSDPVKTLIRRDKARERRAKDEKLAPRSELIVRLWMENKSESEMIAAVREFDEQNEKAVDATLCMRPLGNHTNTPLQLTLQTPPFRSMSLSSSATLSTASPRTPPPLQPEVAPALTGADVNGQFVACLHDYLAGMPQPPPPAHKPEDGDDVFADLFRPMQMLPTSWEYPVADTLAYEPPLDAVLAGFGFGNDAPPTSLLDVDALPTLELGGLDNLNALGGYNTDHGTGVDGLLNYYAELSTFPEYNYSS